MANKPEENGLDVLHMNASLAIGLLADAIDSDTPSAGDVAEAKDHLQTALDAVSVDTEAAERTERALEYLDAAGEQQPSVRDALAELAPVAAELTDADTDTDAGAPERRSLEDAPEVPVFYPVPPAAADRALERFEYALEHAEHGGDHPPNGGSVTLRRYLYDEIRAVPVIWVGGQTLAEYASEAGLESLSIEGGHNDE